VFHELNPPLRGSRLNCPNVMIRDAWGDRRVLISRSGSAHYDESVECEVKQLEVIKDIGSVFLEIVVPQQEFLSDKDYELHRCVETSGEFVDE
jgi:hypothetical protein